MGYDIEGRIGSGGFAEVFRATATGGETVALKIARAADPRFSREAAVLRLLDGAGAPRLIAEEAAGNRPVLVMELVEGESVSRWLERIGGSVSPRRAVERLEAICAAVAAIHDAGFVHRDLKPDNLIFRDDGSVAVLDFGLAIPRGDTSVPELDVRHTQTGERVGTALYMAPEQVGGGASFDARTDVYALGALLFEMIAGRPPFLGSRAVVEQGHLSRRPPSLSKLVATASALDPVISAALAKQPSERPADARALFELAKQALAEPVATETARSVTRPVNKGRTTTRPIALIFVRTGAAVTAVTRALEAEGGLLHSTLANGFVGAFPAAAAPGEGVRSCISAANRLADADRFVIHVCPLRVREGPRGVRLPVQPLAEDWLTSSADARLVLTKQAAEALGAGATVPTKDDLFLIQPADSSISGDRDDREPTFVGRSQLLAALDEAAERCRHDRRPGHATVVAETGMGKTRLLDELVGLLAGAWDVIALSARPPDLATPGDLLRDVLVSTFTLSEMSVAAVRDACMGSLDRDAESLWPAVAASLNLLQRDDPRVLKLQAAPGAYRQTLARAIALALAGRARTKPLAVVVDDAHFADQTTLDALELAALAEREVPLWICATAGRQLFETRPEWGDRASDNRRFDLDPLEPPDIQSLLLELVRPVEYVTKPVMDLLVEKTGGVPARAVELVKAMHALGSIRRQPGTQSWFVAADDVSDISVAGLAERLAQRTLAKLPPMLHRMAELCAVLDDPFAVSDVASLAELESDEGLDPSVGLPRLVRAGILVEESGLFGFAGGDVRDALERQLGAGRRQLHATMLASLESEAERSPAVLVRIARHALAVGERERAGRAYLELAHTSSSLNQDAEAERFYSRALALLSDDDSTRQAVLMGRGVARYRLWRMSDALEDLRAARALAEERDDHESVVELLLEEATILDWRWQFDDERPLVEKARMLAQGSPTPRLEGRLLAAEGRVAHRSEQLADAVSLLTRAVETAREAEDHETVQLVLLMLAPTLAQTGDYEHSKARFADAIEACEHSGDRLHLGVAYTNRLLLWTRIKAYAHAVEDGKRAIDLAREVGYAPLERVAQHNIAELLLFMDRAEAARPLAERARDLEQRFYENPQRESAILVARVLASLGETDAALAAVREIRESSVALAPMPDLHLQAIELLAAGAPRSSWEPLLAEARDNEYEDEKIEIVLRAVTAQKNAGEIDEARELLAEARELAGPESPWMTTIGRLEGELGGRSGD